MQTKLPNRKKYHEDFYHHAVKIASDYEKAALYRRSPYEVDIDEPIEYGLIVPSGVAVPNYAYAMRELEDPKYLYEFTIGLDVDVPRSPNSIEELRGPIRLTDVPRMLYGFEALRQQSRIPYRQIGEHTIINLDNLRLHFQTKTQLLKRMNIHRNQWNGGFFGSWAFSECDFDPPVVLFSTIREVHRMSKSVEDRRGPEDVLEQWEERRERLARVLDARDNQKLASKFRYAPRAL